MPTAWWIIIKWILRNYVLLICIGLYWFKVSISEFIFASVKTFSSDTSERFFL